MLKRTKNENSEIPIKTKIIEANPMLRTEKLQRCDYCQTRVAYSKMLKIRAPVLVFWATA